MNYFQELGLNQKSLQAIENLGFETPSEIQKKVIPTLLDQETDIIGLAQTGTGKTAAFGFPMIQKIDLNYKSIQGLILSPTRELCVQITQELKLYAKYNKEIRIVAIYGGASITEQANAIKKGVHIVVATPGRMQDMMRRKLIDIRDIRYCVLDEADEMLNMGFYEDITNILADTPEEKSTWLFSATMPKEVAIIAKKFMNTPIEITVGSKNSGAVNVKHEYYVVQSRDRYLALKYLTDASPDIFSVVFCRTRRETQNVAERLIEDGYNAAALHGELSQHQRDIVMKAFRSNQVQILVATDVAARGIDVNDITHVINYQLPDEVEIYTHRSGRTGRAGKSGISMVIITKSELRKIQKIEKIIQQKFEARKIPTAEEICEIQLYHLASKIKNTPINQDIDQYLPAVNDVLKDIDREVLIRKMFSVAFSRFASYYKKAKNLNINSGDNNSQTSERNDVRYFINIGARDGYDWRSLKDFIKATMNLGKEDLYKVEVKESFSFFNTEAEHSKSILQTFSDFKMDGRYINVEISKNPATSSKKRRRKSKSTAPKTASYHEKKFGKPHFKSKKKKKKKR